MIFGLGSNMLALGNNRALQLHLTEPTFNAALCGKHIPFDVQEHSEATPNFSAIAQDHHHDNGLLSRILSEKECHGTHITTQRSPTAGPRGRVVNRHVLIGRKPGVSGVTGKDGVAVVTLQEWTESLLS
ncbi:uncharacterized [Tachysurus ichikawai]